MRIIRGVIRFPRRRSDRRAVMYAILILLPIGVWFALMQAYIALAPVDLRLQERDTDSVVALPHGTTLLEPRGTPGRNIADWLSTHPQGVRSFEVGGNQFVGESADLTDESVARISRLAAMLKAARDINVTVVGHSAAEQGHDLGLQLAARRALRVRLELMQFGIAGNRIAVESRGASDPIAPNDSTPSRTNNRVALVLIHNDTGD
jgi:outer membrane protein OmpA-like peptidoglycan-associated protein